MDFKRSDVEAMAEGEMAVCFVNGAIRSSEQLEMAELCRRKSQILIAYGSCSHQGGIPGLSNLYEHETTVKYVYEQSPSTVNPEKVRPQAQTKVPEGGTSVSLPTLDERVKALDQVVEVDYYLPGCPPPVALLKGALEAILSGKLPVKGTVLAPDVALCEECPRIGSKPADLSISQLKRPHEVELDPETCLLAQGLLCLGPATRSGCGAPCMAANMPCTGSLGPVGRVHDQGGEFMGALGSLLGAEEEEKIGEILDGVVDPAGTFYRYGLAKSALFSKKFK
jgi:F420-non-reducing hydrogenase small subunit